MSQIDFFFYIDPHSLSIKCRKKYSKNITKKLPVFFCVLKKINKIRTGTHGAFPLVRTQFYMLSGPPPPFLHVIRNGNV